MSNKRREKLHLIDQQLRDAYPVGMVGNALLELAETQVVIRKVCGFELFNTRPYHNYESWSDGYEATDGRVYVQAEDLDDCVKKLCELSKLSDEDLHPMYRATPRHLERFDNKTLREENYRLRHAIGWYRTWRSHIMGRMRLRFGAPHMTAVIKYADKNTIAGWGPEIEFNDTSEPYTLRWYKRFSEEVQAVATKWLQDPHLFHEVDDMIESALKRTIEAIGGKPQ